MRPVGMGLHLRPGSAPGLRAQGAVSVLARLLSCALRPCVTLVLGARVGAAHVLGGIPTAARRRACAGRACPSAALALEVLGE
eukprot:4675100-Alexandrium_andersonii.AAC.1